MSADHGAGFSHQRCSQKPQTFGTPSLHQQVEGCHGDLALALPIADRTHGATHEMRRDEDPGKTQPPGDVREGLHEHRDGGDPR